MDGDYCHLVGFSPSRPRRRRILLHSLLRLLHRPSIRQGVQTLLLRTLIRHKADRRVLRLREARQSLSSAAEFLHCVSEAPQAKFLCLLFKSRFRQPSPPRPRSKQRPLVSGHQKNRAVLPLFHWRCQQQLAIWRYWLGL